MGITQRQKTFNCTVEISGVDGCETPVTVHYHTSPAHKGSTDGRVGLKLEPDEPARLEIDWIEGPNGEEINLTKANENFLIENIAEHESGMYDPPEPEGYHDGE